MRIGMRVIVALFRVRSLFFVFCFDRGVLAVGLAGIAAAEDWHGGGFGGLRVGLLLGSGAELGSVDVGALALRGLEQVAGESVNGVHMDVCGCKVVGEFEWEFKLRL